MKSFSSTCFRYSLSPSPSSSISSSVRLARIPNSPCFLAILFVAVLSSFSLAAAKHPTPVAAVTPFQEAAQHREDCCPTNPLQYCDFYFNGFYHTLPTFQLKDNIQGDHALSTVPAKKLKWRGHLDHFSPGIVDSITGSKVSVASSWQNGTFLSCPIPTQPHVNPGNQFFMTGTYFDWQAKLYARRWQRGTEHQHGIKLFRDRCVRLPISSLLIAADKGPIKLEFEDGNPKYPAKRRCVVFKTGI
eukprot:TRINITY_DN511_c0_g1_i1.p1 TRINITY_DN511_c0_g1~~TRINITY_DN511_c0_g1_i1.p1  ORF type:complete len:245 (-),score=40.14 TRINITY_DN511_c0_g1_i1:1303-2037(-)